MAQSTSPRSGQPSFTIIFSYERGGLRATLENGASFWVASHEALGKLGENLDLFRRAVEPKSNLTNITVVAPGTAEGVRPERDKGKKLAAKRLVEDQLRNLEIKL